VRLARRLGPADAVVLGLGAMVGAGVFAAIGPAARAAGSGLLLGLALAAAVAWCNATSSARLAARYPESGGAYVYGRERLGPFWGYLAGWAFVVGKTASCAAMALTFATYAAPGATRPVAVAAVVASTAVNYRGLRKTAVVTRVVVAVVLAALGAVVVASLAGGQARVVNLRPFPGAGPFEVLEAAGLLFFAFAGYARIATLGEEVRDPERTIRRTIPVALGVTLTLYALVAVSALLAVGPQVLAGSEAPLAAAVQAGDLAAVAPVVRVGAGVASLGVLVSLSAGVSRTMLAMGRRGDLPSALAAVHPRHRVPGRAVLAFGAVVAGIAMLVDLRRAIGFSSFTVLVYYAVANAAALRLEGAETRTPMTALAGMAGCALLALSLPATSVTAGMAVLAVGSASFWIRSRGPRRR
jgi:basic amino acid/polyamine antiporter, APA family